MKKLAELPVNDGGGLYDNLGLIDTIVIDCKKLLESIFSGDFVKFEVIHIGIIQKLSNLKTGVKNDTEALQNEIKELMEQIGTYRKLIDDMNEGKE